MTGLNTSSGTEATHETFSGEFAISGLQGSGFLFHLLPRGGWRNIEMLR